MTITDEQTAEIESQRAVQTKTLRVTVPNIERHLYIPFKVLDHGFIRVVDYMGDDSAIVQAARVSYGQGTKKSRDDSGLINYLMRHWHSTPFEMCEIKMHIKLPVFVARQWIRHRTANVNEYSARYSILDNEFYIPSAENLATQSQHNNQGRGRILEGKEARDVLEILKADSIRCYENYEQMLSNENKDGLARELARMNLPMNIYTQWYWKTNLHNLFNFLRLRADSHAQYEIRVYADEILRIISDWVPAAVAAFRDYRLDSVQISGKGLACLKRLLAGENVDLASSKMTPGEWKEFQSLLK